MFDALEKAKTTSEWSFQAAPSGPFEGGENLSIDWVMHRAKLAALIAIAEELRTLNATLHDATDLNGAIKLTIQIDDGVER